MDDRVNKILAVGSLLLALAASLPCQVSVRLREITQPSGVRSNFLHGTGLVVGLAGTGDGTAATRQALVNFLQRLGNNLPLNDVSSANAALVTLTAELPPFSRNGRRIDVQLSAAGDATSLFGGTLVQAELLGPDGKVYALAQGPVTVGGFLAQGRNARVTRGHNTVGRIPGGAIVETEVYPRLLDHRGELELLLLNPDWRTAEMVAAAINQALGDQVMAAARDAAAVRVLVPPKLRAPSSTVELLARIGDLSVEPQTRSKVIINERSGTIVVGEMVRVSPCVVAISDLTVHVVEEERVVQPNQGISRGRTALENHTRIEVDVGQNPPAAFSGGASVSDVVRSLKALEASPRQMIEVFTELAASGYLHAELVVR